MVIDDASREGREDRSEGYRPPPLTVFQMAEVAVPQDLFRRILDRIDG